MPANAKPIIAPEKSDIPSRLTTLATEPSDQSNGTAATNGANGKRKRDGHVFDLEGEVIKRQRMKVVEQAKRAKDDRLVVLEDDGVNGAIVIDDL